LRAIGDGYVSIIMPAYLLALGYNAFEIGALMTATLLGSATLTLLAGMITARFGERRPLLAASWLMVFTGLGFAGFETFWPLLLIAFVGTLNPSVGDVSVFLPLEQSLLARSAGDQDRTLLFAFYSMSGSLMGALGTLFAGASDIAPKLFAISSLETMRLLFVIYAGIGIAAGHHYGLPLRFGRSPYTLPVSVTPLPGNVADPADEPYRRRRYLLVSSLTARQA